MRCNIFIDGFYEKYSCVLNMEVIPRIGEKIKYCLIGNRVIVIVKDIIYCVKDESKQKVYIYADVVTVKFL